MLSSVMVEAYGARCRSTRVANVTSPEPQLLQISPFDPSNIKAITNAIRTGDLGFNPQMMAGPIRVPIPPLTEERRREMVKNLGEKVEDCRIAMRTIRQDAEGCQAHERRQELSEDDVKQIEKGIDDDMRDFQAQDRRAVPREGKGGYDALVIT